MGLLTQTCMNELKKSKRVEKKTSEEQINQDENEQEEVNEEDIGGQVEEGQVEGVNEEDIGGQEEDSTENNMPGRIGERDQLQKLQRIGFGFRSFGYDSPYKGRKNGTTARMQASNENRTAQISYELKGKSCVKCKKQFRDGDKLKSKVIRCDKCGEFVHEKTNACKVDLTRGNPTSYACPPCTEGLKSGMLILKELFQIPDDSDIFITATTIIFQSLQYMIIDDS